MKRTAAAHSTDDATRGPRWRRSGDQAFSAALLVTSLWLLAETLGLGSGARRVPIAVILPVLALLIAHLIRKGKPSPAPVAVNAVRPLAIPWILMLPVTIFVFGMYAGPGLYTLAFARVRGRDTWGAAIVLSAAVAVGAWLLVGVLLGGAGPEGAVWSLLAR